MPWVHGLVSLTYRTSAQALLFGLKVGVILEDMKQHHRFHYSEEERRRRQNPEQILLTAGLQEGMCLVDIGCNDGFFTLPAARIVGTTGKVIAIDVDTEALERLRVKLDQASIQNTEVIDGPAEDTVACEKCANLIFLGMVLHDFRDPVAALSSAKRMLHANGCIYNYDWKKQDTPIGPPQAIRFSEDQVRQLAHSAGLHVVETRSMDKHFYSVTMKHEPITT